MGRLETGLIFFNLSLAAIRVVTARRVLMGRLETGLMFFNLSLAAILFVVNITR